MTIEEIQAELDKMAKAMGEAGVKRPDAQAWLRSHSRPLIHMTGDGIEMQFLHGDTTEDCIAKAWKFIHALPDPQVAILATYSKKLADAIDYGHENNVPAKLVDPVRRAQKATSDMMLPAPSED